MAVSANFAFELSRDHLITSALQLAGLLDSGGTATGDDISMAARFLNLELQSLANEGITLYQKERPTPLTLVPSQATYPLAADTLDVIVGPDNFAGTIVNASNDETQVMAIPAHEYVLRAQKDTEASYPTHVYIEKQATVTVTFWPVPAEAFTFRYQRVRLIRDVDTGNVTMDMARRWQKAIWYTLAGQLASAKSKPLDIVRHLDKQARDEKDRARAADREMTAGQLYVPRYSGGCV